MLAVDATWCAAQAAGPGDAKTNAPSATPEQRALAARAQQLVKRMDELHRAKKFKEGIPVAADFLKVCRQMSGDRSANTAFALHQLAYFHSSAGNPAEAKQFNEQALAIRRKVLGNKHPHVALSLRNLSDALFHLDEYDEALACREEALKICLAIAEKSIDVADLLHLVGKSQHQKKDYEEAVANFERAVAMRKELLGDKHPDTAEALVSLGTTLVHMGKFAEARRSLEQALTIYHAAFGEKNPGTASALVSLGYAHEGLKDFAAAKACYQRAIAARKEALGANDPGVLDLYERLGEVLYQEGDFVASRRCCVTAAKGYRQTRGDRDSKTIQTLAGVGNIDIRLGQDGSARAQFEKTLAIASKAYGEKDPETLWARIPLASLMNSLGNVEEAERQFREAMAIASQLPEEHVNTAHLYHEFGGFLAATGRQAEGQKFLKRALAIRKKVHGETHVRAANTIDSLAILCTKLRDYPAATNYAEQSLKIRQATLPEKHPLMTVGWLNVGYTAALSGDVDKAIDYTNRAVEIERGLTGVDHQGMAIALSNLARFSIVRGDMQAAARYADQSRRLVRRHVVGVLSTLSEAEQLGYLRKQDSFMSSVAYGIAAHGQNDPQIAALSAGWLLNAKGLAQEVLAERAVLARESRDPTTRDLAQQLVAVRSRQARVKLTATSGENAQRLADERARLGKEEESLSRQLASAGARAPRTRPWVELDELRSKLGPNEVLIDIAGFPRFDSSKSFPEELWSDRYLAWIIPRSGDVRIVDLGDAQKIERAVVALRVALKNVLVPTETAGVSKLDMKALHIMHGALTALSVLVMHPLVKHVGSATEISLSPDAGLWLVPWNALLLEDGRFAVEKYPIRYLASCRELVAPKSSIPAGRPLIVASPDFDLDPETARRLTAQLLGKKEPADAPKAQVRSTSASSEPIATPLPAFAKQPELVNADLIKFTGKKPGVLAGRNALEGLVKAVHRPRVALFATHGYFEPTLGMSAAEIASLADYVGMSGKAPVSRPVNPLLHCGILMAGCNRREHSEDEDGILTGMEIAGIDLRGTELVVLSACDTGVGEVRVGEGVASVRQAFQLAGAEAVISSLWPVDVGESTRQVSGFFSNMAAGQTKAQSLRSAQLDAIKRLKKQFDGAAPPLFWAAFTVTGR
jgi:tetratricopeptide (TPR) repeat protein/CHAT domain-containing protein